MIHTMTIKHDITREAAAQILHVLGKDDERDEFFLSSRSRRIDIPSPCAGIQEMTLHRFVKDDYGYSKIFYIVYIRMEPLTVITGEQHIRLFECTEDNIQRLVDIFRAEMSAFFLDGAPRNPLNELAELSTWDADRVDYTKDVVMNNHDEVLAMMNICKMSVLSNCRRKALRTTSIYGKHFYDSTLIFGNKGQEIAVYDKQKEIEKRRESYPDDIYDRLNTESENILRFEYRRKRSGTKKGSTKFDDRNIMRFLSECVAERWFHKFYGDVIGYEPFYVLDYPLQKKLAEGFPMTQIEERTERKRREEYDKRKKAARNTGRNTKPFEKRIMGKNAEEYYNHISFISTHKGMQNALKAYTGTTSKFKAWNKRIRERAHVSPVAIPKNWIYRRPNGNGRALDIPHDFLPNPIQRPSDGLTD